MMFVDLHPATTSSPPTSPPTRTWSESSLNTLATQWKDLLKTAGYDATLYAIEGDRLLASLAKGWHGEEVKKFFVTRSEVEMVTWNNVETVAGDWTEE